MSTVVRLPLKGTVKLSLDGKDIFADVISFSTRLKYEDVLYHVGTDDDWEIFTINENGCFYVAYQQCSAYDRV